MSFNKIILVGHLGRDPELRYTPQGVPVCSFSLATSEKKGKGGGESGANDITTWFNVTLWREKAELAGKYLSKGRLVYIEGRLTQREYQDRNGVTRTSLDVTGTEVHFIDSRDGQGRGGESSPGPQRESRAFPSSAPSSSDSEYDSGSNITDEDIPF